MTDEEYLAHIRKSDGVKQGVFEHCEGTALLSMQTGLDYGLTHTSYLAGLLHDLGKNTDAFHHYITASYSGERIVRGSVTHSVQGAVYLTSLTDNASDLHKIAAELIRCAVLSHHGLRDCVDTSGKMIYEEAKQRLDEGYGAICEYISQKYPDGQMRERLDAAVLEISSVIERIIKFSSNNPSKDRAYCPKSFVWSMYTRLLSSILIDADRTDTACFENELLHPQQHLDRDSRRAMWSRVLLHFNKVLSEKTAGVDASTSPLNIYRREISQTCGEYDLGEGAIHRLVIPCGSGKTLASLRMALENAVRYGKKRIIYIAPYNSILEQNASEIRRFVGEECGVLEHHSGVVFDLGADEDEEAGEKYKSYRLLTENWRDSPVIATTAVQFLDTLFSGKTSSVRRMQALGDSIIILDEIQALPVKVLKLFNSAMNFLSYFCSSSVVLCSATQPPLDIINDWRMIKPKYIINDTDKYFHAFKRVDIKNAVTGAGYTYSGTADFIASQLVETRSLLAIVNTKRCAREIYEHLKSMMLEREGEYRIYHLSTLMCASHRQKVLDKIRGLLADKTFTGKIICVSTQLIEAGVDISFGRVVRSLAGLDSVVQAAGRCNRHRTEQDGQVHIIYISEEDVSKLTDIRKAQDAARQVLLEYEMDNTSMGNDLLSDKAMDRYYRIYYQSRLDDMRYRLPYNPDSDMLDLLSENKFGRKGLQQKGINPKSILLHQAFAEAGRVFNVIDDNGNTDVIIRRDPSVDENLRILSSKESIWKKSAALRQLQRYTVGLSKTMLLGLGNAAIYDAESGVYILADGHYSEEYGITSSRVEDMKLLEF